MSLHMNLEKIVEGHYTGKRENCLIREMETLCVVGFPDMIIAFASNIEDALKLSGAVPGKDYTRKDLIEMAQPYVIEWFKENSPLWKSEMVWPCKQLFKQ